MCLHLASFLIALQLPSILISAHFKTVGILTSHLLLLVMFHTKFDIIRYLPQEKLAGLVHR